MLSRFHFISEESEVSLMYKAHRFQISLHCDAIENKTIQLEYCPTDEMIADVLTKGLPRPQFEKLRSKLGVIN